MLPTFVSPAFFDLSDVKDQVNSDVIWIRKILNFEIKKNRIKIILKFYLTKSEM